MKIFQLCTLSLLILGIFISGCSDNSDNNEPDADTDSTTDGDADTDVDSDSDTDIDADADSDTDTDADTDADADVETGPMPHDLIYVNYGGTGDLGRDQVNGHFSEHWLRFSSPWLDRWKADYDAWMAEAREPHIYFMDVNTTWDPANAPDPAKNYYRLMRYGLCSCLLGDGYFAFEDGLEHYYNPFYDEFEINLGNPTEDAQALENGCWVRFFENGVSLVNPTGETQTVSDADLQSLAGYSGPYHRFQGNQDPVTNNGESFDSVTLLSTDASNGDNVGDGIILLRESGAVVTDVIVDNCAAATSPGSSPAVFHPSEGDWHDDPLRAWWAEHLDPYWAIGPSWPSDQRPEYLWSQSSDGSRSAEYIPTINVAGQWEVFEWHGWREVVSVRQNDEASNVPYTIHHADGTSTGTIDQTTGYGQWNSLGTFRFEEGTSGRVVITNDANGSVIADAFKFVYRDQRERNRPTHGYPRFVSFTWGGGTWQWYAQFDLIVMRPITNEDALEIRALNPDVYILQTYDWMGYDCSQGCDRLPPDRPEYYIVDSSGNPITYYDRYMHDPTDYCHVVEGERYNQFGPRVYTDPEHLDLSIFNGTGSDGMWNRISWHADDIDLDRNGVNDWNEHGKDWINETWREGWEIFIRNLRAEMSDR